MTEQPIHWERVKRPAENVWYELKWGKFLPSDETIATSTWTVLDEESSLEVEEADIAGDNRVAQVRLSGGEAGEVWLANTITLTSGNDGPLERKVRLTIE